MTNRDETGIESSGILVHSISKRHNEEIRFAISEFNNTKYIDIRSYFMSKDGSEFRPSRKGVTLPVSMFKELTQGVTELGKTLGTVEESKTVNEVSE